MKTFVQTRIIFLDALAQLKRLEGPEKITQTLHAVKEREAGKLCYQAEEDWSEPLRPDSDQSQLLRNSVY
jgi:hypothetical protein